MAKNIEIMTLDVSELIHNCKKKVDNKYCYVLDLKDVVVKHKVILSTEYKNDNALFYQLSLVKKALGYSECQVNKFDIIYLDFASLYSKYIDKECAQEDVERLVNKGLEIENGECTYKYKAFDKSASMARQSKISFINEKYIEESDKLKNLNDRLDMDIFCPQTRIQKSKYYAYRGLYFSDGQCIEKENAFVLNEKTVLIIDDFVDMNSNANKEVFTYDAKEKDVEEKDVEEKDVEDPFGTKIIVKDKKKTISKKEMKLKIDCFDGEGLIDFAYAKHLSTKLTNKADVATSFQIRMPFAKGMLHKANFREILENEFKIDNYEELEIVDYFEIKRSLKDVHIIMPRSMFKCANWLEKWQEEQKLPDGVKKEDVAGSEYDPMHHYFDNFDKFDHALYITRTNANLHNDGTTKLNYQFLNTGTLTAEQFKTLADQSLENLKKFCNSAEEQIKYISNLDTDNINQENHEDEGEKSFEQIENEKLFDKFSKIIKTNPYFIKDKKISGQINGYIASRYIDNAIGRLTVKGETRFLSGDLLKFVELFSRKLLSKKDWKDIKTLPQDQFCAPGFNLYANNTNENKNSHYEKNYAILRNPHLSRNEHCVLKPTRMYGSAENPGLYRKYFSHLTGVVMLPYASLKAMRMGGADFDGDFVRIIDNDIFNESSEKCDEENYPTIVIPSENEGAIDFSKKSNIDYAQLKPVFNNKVGEISNLAMKFGSVGYNENRKKEDTEKYQEKSAQCCIYVGQEIDKAKTGKGPDLEAIKEEGKDIKFQFLKIKNLIPSLRFASPTTTSENKISFYLREKGQIDIKNCSKNSPNLLSLPYYVFKEKFAAKDNSEDNTPKVKYENKRELLFKDYTESEVSSETVNKMKALICAYNNVSRKAKELRKTEKKFQNNNFINKAYNILYLQYDDIDKVESNENSYRTSLKLLSSELYSKDLKDLEKYLSNLVKYSWQNTPCDENYDGRKNVLTDKIFENSEFKVYYDILINFNNRGYNILYYLLKGLICEKITEDIQTLNEFIRNVGDSANQIDNESNNDKDIKNEKPNVANENHQDRIAKLDGAKFVSYNKHYNDWLKMHLDGMEENASFVKVNQDIIEECREIINNEGLNFGVYLMVEGKFDYNSDFMWDIFSAKEILEEVKKERGGKDRC